MLIKDCVLIEPYMCNETDSVIAVAKKLRDTTLRHIFVVNKGCSPKGIISVVDINNRVVALGKDPKKLRAKDIMSTPIDMVSITDDVKSTARKMIERQRSMNPVLKGDKMVGIITLNQLLNYEGKK